MSARNLTPVAWRNSYYQLAVQLARRHQDEQDESRGVRVIYALDNDVITLITAPWRNSRQHYLKLFGHDDIEAIDALGNVLAEFFLTQNGDFPYVIVRPAEMELEGRWNQVYSQAVGEQEQLTSGMDLLLRNEFPGDDQSLFNLVEQACEIVFGRGGALTELQRISHVITMGGIRRMDSVLDENGQSPFPSELDADVREMARLERYWLDGLNRSKPHSGRDHSIDGVLRNNLVDAAVLARIQWINSKFSAEGGHTKLCFITGDTHIEKVAANLTFSGDTFANRFIRTPVCFLQDERFLNKFRNGNSSSENAVSFPSISIGECLRVLSPVAQDDFSDFLSRDVERKVINEMRLVMDHGKRLIKGVSASSRINQRFLDALNHHVSAQRYRDLPEVRHWYESLKAQVEDVRDEALTRFGVSGALAAFWSLDYRRRRVERNIPPVKFDSLARAHGLLQQLRDANSFRDLQTAVNRQWVTDLYDEDPSGYTALIVFSLAHACASEWHTALTVAHAAVLTAKRLWASNNSRTIKGDEAAYLCAVFARLSAKDIRGLDDAETWLALAEQLQRRPPIRASLSAIDIDKYQDPRFMGEQLATRLSKRFFAEASNSTQRDLGQLPLSWSIKEECSKYDALRNCLELECSSTVKRYVEEQVAVNLLQWQLLAAIRGEKHACLWAENRDLLGHLASRRVPGASLVARDDSASFLGSSRLVYFVFLCASAVFAPEIAGWDNPALRQDLLDVMRRTGSDLRVMPYDEWRASAFIAAAEGALQTV